jgi:hypothetical protein
MERIVFGDDRFFPIELPNGVLNYSTTDLLKAKARSRLTSLATRVLP